MFCDKNKNLSLLASVTMLQEAEFPIAADDGFI